MGRITRVTENAGAALSDRTYAYDAAGRLNEAGEEGATDASYLPDTRRGPSVMPGTMDIISVRP